MSTFHLEYQLQKGYVHNWLVAGPYAIAISDLDRFEGQDYKLQIARHHYRRISDINDPPVERESFQVGDTEFTWRYRRCLDDHFVDLSTFCHTCHYLRSWAYSQVISSSSQEVTFVLTTNGPADLWLNRQHVHRQEHFHRQDPRSVSFQGTLEEGPNEILVRFEEVAARECPYVMALQIAGFATQEIAVHVPTTIENVKRRQMFERAFEQAHLEHDIDYGGGGISMRWSDDLDTRCSYTLRLQDWRDRIYLEGSPEAKPGEVQAIGHQIVLQGGQYRVVLMPRPDEYYQSNVRYQRHLPVRVLDNTYSETLYGTFGERRKEALEDAAGRENNLYAEIAKFALGRWASVDRDLIVETTKKINQREDCSDFYLVGLLGMMYRTTGALAFTEKLERTVEKCVLNFKYWHDEPGSDAMCYTTENHSILFHTCEILAGQLYPDRTFTNAGQMGRWHREKGEKLALAWLHERGTTGFSEWDSNCYFEEDLLALSHLADLAGSEEVRELAAVVMDKMFFTMALNSYKGVFGSTHGRTYAPMIKGGQLEATSGITRLMWGMGIYNQHIRGTVSLACSDYVLPPIIPDIATDLDEELWNREHHPGVNKVTYRTADYMLCSAQDYRPGEKGYQQHIWQATLGPSAVVFVNHPPCMSEEGAHRPNFWHGNYVLPRVAQWKDALIAIYKLPDDDWLGFTHAYFPVYEFDEYVIRDGWAFARKGGGPPPSGEDAPSGEGTSSDGDTPSGKDTSSSKEPPLDEGRPAAGYLALTASQGLRLIKRGPSAYRELRSYGQHNVWWCLMGRAAIDGSFEDFQERVLALDVNFEELGVQCTTWRGETLSFAWQGPLLVNGKEQPITGFKHYENPYCVADLAAELMEIRYGEYLLRLHFELPEQGA